jgi:hypothetical protein
MTTSNNMLNCLVPVPRGRPRFHAVSITSYHYSDDSLKLKISHLDVSKAKQIVQNISPNPKSPARVGSYRSILHVLKIFIS